MFCRYCGTQLPDDSVFCTGCGKKLIETVQPAYQQPVYQQPVYQQPAYQQPVYQQPVYQQPAPQPVYEQPAPQPVYEQPAPQPVYEQPAPQPVYEQPAPQPVYEQPAPQPVYEQPAPQPVYEQPAPQPVYEQPVSDHVTNRGEAVEAQVTVLYPDKHSEIGKLLIWPDEIVFLKKSRAVVLAFGMIGHALEKGKEKLRFPVADIVSGQRERYGLNKNCYRIFMKNGESYLLLLSKSKHVDRLSGMIENRR